MTNSQSQFLKDKELCKMWTAIALTDDFQKVVTYARAALLEGQSLTPDMMAGVNLLATTLVSLCDSQEQLPANFNIGLVHDLQPRRNTGVASTDKKKE